MKQNSHVFFFKRIKLAVILKVITDSKYDGKKIACRKYLDQSLSAR